MRPIPTLGMFLTVCASAFACIPAIVLPSFNDIFWQIAEGREVLAGHIPTSVPNAISAGVWIDHEWLFEALAAFAYDHGCYFVLVAICAAIGASIPILIFLSVRERSTYDLGAGLAACSGMLLMCRYDAIRPLQFGVGACALLFFLLRTKRTHPLPYLLVAVCWANFHASVVLAPVVSGFFAIGAWRAGDVRLRRAYISATIACVVGSLCTPSNVALYTYAVSHLGGQGGSTQYIAEWNPFAFHGLIDWLSVGFICIAVARGWRDESLSLAERLGSLAFMLLALHQQRQAAFLAVACAAVMARAFPGMQTLRTQLFAPVGIGLVVAVLAVETPTLMRADALGQNVELPGLFAQLKPRVEPVNAYIDYDIAGYAALTHAPFRLLIDSHADCFAPRVFADWLALANLDQDWRGALARNDIHLVVVQKTAAIAQALRLLPTWKVVAESKTYIGLADTPSPISIRSAMIRSRTNVAISR